MNSERHHHQSKRHESNENVSGLTESDSVDNLAVMNSYQSSPVKPLSKPSKTGDRAQKPLPHQPREKERTRDGASNSRRKDEVGLDLIDRLDISGLYGGGGLSRHDGPYAAASANRNKGPRAPMMAFDPSVHNTSPKSSTAPPRPPRNGNSTLSARAQAALSAMEGNEESGGHYGKMGAAGEHARRNSDGSVTMGFPSSNSSGKGQQLVEMFGVRDNEAWEDFGTSKYSGMKPRDSVLPPGVSKAERNDRAQSIWDIEATLRAGKPVGAVPPPLPTLLDFSEPAGYHNDKIKRSKSLVSRFRSVRKNPDTPMLEEDDDSPATHQVLNNHRTPPQQESSLPKELYGSAPPGVRFGANRYEEEAGDADPRKLRFGGGTALSNTKSLGQEGGHDPDRALLVRRPSVMQRLFRGKGK